MRIDIYTLKKLYYIYTFISYIYKKWECIIANRKKNIFLIKLITINKKITNQFKQFLEFRNEHKQKKLKQNN